MDFLGHMESGDEEESDLEDIFFGEVINLSKVQVDVDVPLQLVTETGWTLLLPTNTFAQELVAPIYDDPPPGPLIPRGPPSLMI